MPPVRYKIEAEFSIIGNDRKESITSSVIEPFLSFVKTIKNVNV